MNVIRSYQDLDVWQKAMDLVTDCYRVSQEFAKAEIYGLTSQMRRAAVSVPANIAEGQGRQTANAFINHHSIAYGSLCELETHVQIARRLDYIDEQTTMSLLQQTATIGRMLNGLTRSLRTDK